MANKTQIVISDEIRDLIADINPPVTASSLVEVRDRMYSKLRVYPYNDSTKDREKSIRWKRTSAEILKDGYIYAGKACTDQVILFSALCQALGLETRFVKLKKEKMVHSIAEIKLNDGRYIFDVSRKENIPIKGEIIKGRDFCGWQLWKKGRDSRDIGLTDFDSMCKIHDRHT